MQPLISIAPMMDCTDRHYRFFMRGLTRHTLLYSEMITANAIVFGDRDHLLNYHGAEHPLALQLGGSDPRLLAQAAAIAAEFDYDAVNLNVGCPSDRVQKGRFGACLMKEAGLVAKCLQAMQQEVDLPVTVKTRLGVDDLDSYKFAKDFVAAIAAAGCQQVTVHARKAWLKGLSPRENREVPPLMYERVYQLKQDFPSLHIGINGGINNLDQAEEHLKFVDEVMIGRAAYSNPGLFAQVDQRFYHSNAPVPTDHDAVSHYLPYMTQQLNAGVRLRTLLRPLIGLFQGQPGARAWRRYLSIHGGSDSEGVLVVCKALDLLEKPRYHAPLS